MRKILTLVLFLGLFLLVKPTFAVEMNNQVREQKRVVVNEMKAKFVKNRSQALVNYCANTNTRLSAMIAKIEVRAKKKVITDAPLPDNFMAKISAAKENLAKAKEACDNAATQYNAVPSNKWRADGSEVKMANEAASKARNYFVIAHKAIAAALAELAKVKVTK